MTVGALAEVLGSPFVADGGRQSRAEREDEDWLESLRLTPEMRRAAAEQADYPLPFGSELALQAAVTRFFRRLEIPFDEQKRAGSGRADICIRMPCGSPWALIELKNFNAKGLSLKDAADFFEQCVKYRIQSGLPVFVGPFFEYDTRLSEHFLGGRRPRTVAALSALGGRMDIGLLFIHVPPSRLTDDSRWEGFQMSMRQQVVASYHGYDEYVPTLWPQKPIKTVNHHSPGSCKDRE